MKAFITELIKALDYRNEFTTKEFIFHTILAIVYLIIACCGESIILNMF